MTSCTMPHATRNPTRKLRKNSVPNGLYDRQALPKRDTSMLLRNPRFEGWPKDIFVAAVAAFVAYPTVGAIWMADGWELSGFLQMGGSEWMVLTVALFVPSALLGVLAGRIARWRSPERAPGAAIAGATAFAVSAATSAAFMWWLSMVL